jgi:hypothetical protein
MRNVQLASILLFGGLHASLSLATAGVLNSHLTTGNLTGWEFDASGDADFIRPSPDPTYPAPFTYSFPLSSTPLFNNVSVRSLAGDDTAAVTIFCGQTGMNPVPFTGPDGNAYIMHYQTYTMSCFQDVQLSHGSRITGRSRFRSEDAPGFGDFAAVTIGGVPVWRFDLNQLENSRLGTETDGPWQSWSFVAPDDGVYRVSLNIYGDDQYSSWADFDNIQVVPELPSTYFLAAGFVLWVAVRIWRRFS